MITSYTDGNDIPSKKKPGRHLGGFYGKMIEDFLASGKDVLCIECESNKEMHKVYSSLYACTKRRHIVNVTRTIRGNNIYIMRKED